MGDRSEFAKNLTSIVESVPSTTITDVPAEGVKVFQRSLVRFKNFNSNAQLNTAEQVVFTAAEDLYSGNLILRGGTLTADNAITGVNANCTMISVKTKYPNGTALGTWANINVALTGTGTTGSFVQFARVNIPSGSINTQLAVIPQGGSVTVSATVTNTGAASTSDLALELIVEAQ